MEEILALAGPLLEAVVAGNWWIAAGILVALLALVVRRYGAKLWAPLATLPGVFASTFVLAALGGLFNTLAAGQAFVLATVFAAIKVGFTAAGGWVALEALFRWFSAHKVVEPPAPAPGGEA